MKYADSNFIVPAYLAIRHKQTVANLLDAISIGRAPPLTITWLTRLEVLNAIEFSVFLGKSGGAHPHVTLEQAMIAKGDFLNDLKEGVLLKQASINYEQVEQLFETISARHTAKHGFRAYDLLHVASALTLNCKEFWTFDSRAASLAKLEGLKVL